MRILHLLYKEREREAPQDPQKMPKTLSRLGERALFTFPEFPDVFGKLEDVFFRATFIAKRNRSKKSLETPRFYEVLGCLVPEPGKIQRLQRFQKFTAYRLI